MTRPMLARMLLVCVLGVPMLAALVGCGNAVRLVRETPDGGEITIPTNTNQWPTYYRSRAAYLMARKCPEGYHVDAERATGIDLEKPTSRKPYESYFGYTGGSEAEQVYHIFFHAVPAGNRAPAGPAGATGPSVRPRTTPPADDGKEELPAPRPLSDPRD